MRTNDTYRKVLTVFAHYGFRKASMEDLARAAGVSRQTLYKRYKTKEAVLDWSVEGMVRESLERVTGVLENEGEPIPGRLLSAFSRWLGDSVALLHDSPHGGEMLDLGMESLKRSGEDFHAIFEQELIRFLLDRGLSKNRDEAADIAFALHMSSKGLLLKSATGEEFRTGMTRIIGTLITQST